MDFFDVVEGLAALCTLVGFVSVFLRKLFDLVRAALRRLGQGRKGKQDEESR